MRRRDPPVFRLNDDITDEQRVVTASRDIAAPAATIFELIAEPSAQPRWDGNDNLAQASAGQLWRWQLEPVDDGRTRVTHTYDWTRLTDEKRQVRARATTAEKLQSSVDRLAALAEQT